MRAFIALALATAVLLAGCSGGKDSDSTTTTTTTPAPTTTTTTPPVQPPPPPPQIPTEPFTMTSSSCRELLFMVPIDAAAARALVPSNYTVLLGQTGKAVAFAGLKMCESLMLDGVDVGNASTSDVGIMIEAPDGTDGIHYYQVWWTSDNLLLVQRLAVQGWVTGWSSNDTVTYTATLPVLADSTFAVPSFNYSGAAKVVAGPLPPENHAYGWHMGFKGELKVDKVLSSSVFGSGSGKLTAGEGSPLVQVIGGTSADGSALWSVYSMTGNVGATQ